jgi:hypothetical protein
VGLQGREDERASNNRHDEEDSGDGDAGPGWSFIRVLCEPMECGIHVWKVESLLLGVLPLEFLLLLNAFHELTEAFFGAILVMFLGVLGDAGGSRLPIPALLEALFWQFVAVGFGASATRAALRAKAHSGCIVVDDVNSPLRPVRVRASRATHPVSLA